MAPSYAVLADHPVASFADYLGGGGGEALARATAMAPADVIAEVQRSGLRGRGGAGFATGRKWSSVVAAAPEHTPVYLVCNAAEGEPGTYKDRALISLDPWQVLEGVLIAAHATGARAAIVATKQHYGEQVARLRQARDDIAQAGWPGADRLEILEGPDEYLYGEESAMLEVIEGKLPLPRILPPYMAGLNATTHTPNPTVVNNVETLSHVTRILADGADAFRAVGTVEAPGTMVFTVVGDVANPGVYELPLGTPLRTLVADIAGAGDIKALYSGTSNTVIKPDLLDLPLDFDSFSEAGSGLGSGGFLVYDSSRCIVQVAAVLSRFLAVESCGQCPPCKLHGVEIWERLEALCRGEGTGADLEQIRRRCQTVTDGNRCYLPVGHALLVRSTLDAFESEFRARLDGTPCEHDSAVEVPKIVTLDDDSGAVGFDPDYPRKQMDWSFR